MPKMSISMDAFVHSCPSRDPVAECEEVGEAIDPPSPAEWPRMKLAAGLVVLGTSPAVTVHREDVKGIRV
jgi:hypothetical protein